MVLAGSEVTVGTQGASQRATMGATEEGKEGQETRSSSPEGAIDSVLQQKEYALQQELSAKEQENAQLREQLRVLADDFRYNLSLIEDRDAELERFEATVDSLRQQLHAKEEEIANIRSQTRSGFACHQQSESNAAPSANSAANRNDKSTEHRSVSDNAPENGSPTRAQNEREASLSRESESLHATVSRVCNENETLRANLRASEAERKATVAELEARIGAKESRIFEVEDELRQYQHSNNQQSVAPAALPSRADEHEDVVPPPDADCHHHQEQQLALAEGSTEQSDHKIKSKWDVEELRNQLSAAYEELGSAYAKLHKEKRRNTQADRRHVHKHKHHHHSCDSPPSPRTSESPPLLLTDRSERGSKKKLRKTSSRGRARRGARVGTELELRGLRDRLERLERGGKWR